MLNYEITAILKEESQNLLDETKAAIKETLNRYSVEIVSEEDWGQKKLWHRINGQEMGFFTNIKCKAAPTSIAKIEHDFKINQNILRAMVCKL